MGLIGILLFALVQLLFFSGMIFLWMRMKRSMDDDSRWSRGLQFLQSKIAVFEDLSDRTETQVKQLTIMMENKICDLQRKIDEADQVLNQISSSMKKSIEVAQIFQDKIPHEEIIERQNTVRFVKAALMAHEGRSATEIAEMVDLPKAQIEFIAKVNAERLSFDTSQMPEWLKSELNKDANTKHSLFEKKNLERLNPSISPRTPLRPLEQVLKQRSLANTDFVEEVVKAPKPPEELSSSLVDVAVSPLATTTPIMESHPPKPSSPTIKIKNDWGTVTQARPSRTIPGNIGQRAKEMGIRPVVFPRIESSR